MGDDDEKGAGTEGGINPGHVALVAHGSADDPWKEWRAKQEQLQRWELSEALEEVYTDGAQGKPVELVWAGPPFPDEEYPWGAPGPLREDELADLAHWRALLARERKPGGEVSEACTRTRKSEEQ